MIRHDKHLAVKRGVTVNAQIYYALKRLMDVVFTVVFLIMTAPLMLVIAVLIKLDSPGPVLFKQTRLGKDCEPFTLYKFRTMYQDADATLHRRYVQSFIRNQLVMEPESDSESTTYKMRNDPRVTRVGRLLRRTSLDELPQLFNVLKGEMSLVGPRPPLPYEMEEYHVWHQARLVTPPGITGWWQIQGRSRVAFNEMVRMDLRYNSQKSLWLDLKILLLTMWVVISGKGAE